MPGASRSLGRDAGGTELVGVLALFLEQRVELRAQDVGRRQAGLDSSRASALHRDPRIETAAEIGRREVLDRLICQQWVLCRLVRGAREVKIEHAIDQRLMAQLADRCDRAPSSPRRWTGDRRHCRRRPQYGCRRTERVRTLRRPAQRGVAILLRHRVRIFRDTPVMHADDRRAAELAQRRRDHVVEFDAAGQKAAAVEVADDRRPLRMGRPVDPDRNFVAGHDDRTCCARAFPPDRAVEILPRADRNEAGDHRACCRCSPSAAIRRTRST